MLLENRFMCLVFLVLVAVILMDTLFLGFGSVFINVFSLVVALFYFMVVFMCLVFVFLCLVGPDQKL